MRRFTVVRSSLALSLLAPALQAQFRQYTPPGDLFGPAEPRAEAVERQAEEARWSLGKLRLAPQLGLSDLGYVDNVFDTAEGLETESDFRGTATAGLDGFLHLGPQTIFTLYGRPRYVWWQEQEELREFDLAWGAGLFGNFNRLQIELVGERREEQGFLSNELRVPLDLATDSASFRFTIDFRGPFGLFGGASLLSADLPGATPEGAAPLDLDPLDRDETLYEGGLLYELGNGFQVGLGAERSEVEFDDDPGGRSNEGTSPLLSLRFAGNRADFDLRAVQRRVEFESETLGESDEVTGALRSTWQLGTKTALSLYGSRQIVYSALDAGAFFTSAFYGGGLGWGQLDPERRRRPRLAVFVERGDDRWEAASAELAGRADDILNYGLSLQVPLRRLAVFELGAIESEIDSNLDVFDRSYTTLRTGLTLRPVGIGQGERPPA